MKKQNFDLTVNEFEQLVINLRKNDTQLFEQVFLTHFEDCLRFLKKKYQVNHSDAYDASMDTMLAFRKRLVEGKIVYGNLKYLFTQMAAQRLMKNIKRNNYVALETGFDIEEEITEIDEAEHRLLKIAWNRLDSGCQDLLQQHFYGKMKLIEIAKETQKLPGAIRKQKQRCLNKLKILLIEIKNNG